MRTVHAPFSLSLMLLGLSLFACSQQKSSANVDQVPIASSQAVLDVFNQKCMPCHATGKPKKGLALDTIQGLIKGADGGPVLAAGDAEKSLIIQRMRATNGKKIMPPMGSPATEEQIRTVEAWITAGANP